MADDKKDPQANSTPPAKFCVLVQFGDGNAAKFQEISGSDSEGLRVDYRHGNSPVFYPIKMPGLGRVGNVTMRKGIFVGDAKFWAWYNEIKMNAGKRRTVVVDLLDDAGSPRMVWTLHNAFPTRIAEADLEAGGNDVAIESLDFVYETIELSAP